MKNRLNLTIDEQLVSVAKRYAARRKISLSQLIEGYLKNLTEKKPARKNILDLVSELPKTKGPVDKVGRDAYYEERKAKYGF